MIWGVFVFIFYFSFHLQEPPDWQEILTHFRGSELQNYFTRILEDDLKVMFMSLFYIVSNIIKVLQQYKFESLLI